MLFHKTICKLRDYSKHYNYHLPNYCWTQHNVSCVMMRSKTYKIFKQHSPQNVNVILSCFELGDPARSCTLPFSSSCAYPGGMKVNISSSYWFILTVDETVHSRPYRQPKRNSNTFKWRFSDQHLARHFV